MRHTGTLFLSHTPPQASTALCGAFGKHTMQHCCPAPPWWWSWSAPASTRGPVARHATRCMPASFTAHGCRRAARSQPVLQREKQVTLPVYPGQRPTSTPALSAKQPPAPDEGLLRMTFR